MWQSRDSVSKLCIFVNFRNCVSAEGMEASFFQPKITKTTSELIFINLNSSFTTVLQQNLLYGVSLQIYCNGLSQRHFIIIVKLLRWYTHALEKKKKGRKKSGSMLCMEKCFIAFFLNSFSFTSLRPLRFCFLNCTASAVC
uniref:Uncharacterized protein n=1 Tax=Trypanosoma vivax (strain Y486) TaxID=1055687 RepID=G0TUR6_TRYVY|nr:hypothetical protein TVY486_0403690 [Trypanosoma vivax Y486]